jgi:hypothetical protein
MDLEKLEQQAKALQNIDPTKMDEKQLTQLAEQLELIFNDSEQLINNLTEELKQENENDDDN